MSQGPDARQAAVAMAARAEMTVAPDALDHGRCQELLGRHLRPPSGARLGSLSRQLEGVGVSAGAELIADFVAGRYRHPETGASVVCPLRLVAIESTLDGGEADLVAAAGLAGQLAVVADENTWPALGARVARLRCPALVIAGELDRMTPARQGARLAEAIPEATFVSIPECGHMLMAERPDTTLDALTLFARHHEAAA